MSSKYSVMVALLCPIVCSAVEPKFEIGQQVEAYDSGWYPGSVIEIGSGNHEGDFLIRFDTSRARWFSVSRLRAPGTYADAERTRVGPRDGRYVLHTLGGTSAAVIGAVDLLSGARYRAWRSGGALLGEGLYRYDEASGRVKWLTGPYAELGYGGHFTASQDGRRHRIQVSDKLIASNANR
jgi:hypothetical protein